MICALYPAECSDELRDGLALTSAEIVEVDDLVIESRAIHEADALVVELGPQPMRRLRELKRIIDEIGLPVLVIADREHLALMDGTDGINDFVVMPLNPVELRLRLERFGSGDQTSEVLRFKDLELNPLNYQAALAGMPMDLTYMEYELLRYLVENPVRVWSREQLLSRVWGYDYYGGARTVDVHIRRLRSKLGEERSSWITTVRSVGYRFG